MTTRLSALNPTDATGQAKALLDGVQSKFGMTPNLMRTLANSPSALKGYLDFNQALAGGVLDPKLREQISIATAEANHCEYCLSAHIGMGKKAGLNDAELSAARQSASPDTKANAALRFAHEITLKRGEVTDADVEAVKQAGFNEAEIVEIVANVALNIFTNYFNHVARTEVDFPKVALSAKQTA